MTTKQNILTKLRSHKQELSNFGVQNISLFGSYSREEQSENSDIDLLIDFNQLKKALIT